MKSLFIFFFLLSSLYVSGQRQSYSLLAAPSGNAEKDFPVIITLQENYLSDVYYSATSSGNVLINGKEYIAYYARSVTSPILYEGKNRKAAIFTGKRQFRGIVLQYDTFLDEVIFTDTTKLINNQFPLVALNKKKIDRFILYFNDDTLDFRNLDFPENQESILSDGFYEIVLNDYLIRHRSKLYPKDGRNEYNYTPAHYYNNGGTWVKIGNIKDLKEISGDHYGELSGWLSRRGIKLKKIDKDQMTALIRYYDALKLRGSSKN